MTFEMFFSGLILRTSSKVCFSCLSGKAVIPFTIYQFHLVIGSSKDNCYLSNYVVNAMQGQVIKQCSTQLQSNWHLGEFVRSGFILMVTYLIPKENNMKLLVGKWQMSFHFTL